MDGDSYIREVTRRDAAEIARLCAQLGYPVEEETIVNRLRRVMEDPDHLLLVAKNDSGKLAGWIHACALQIIETNFRVEILGLIVDEQHRRGGTGRKLVGAIETWAAGIAAQELSVRCNSLRKESHRFYEALGYVSEKTQEVFRKKVGKQHDV